MKAVARNPIAAGPPVASDSDGATFAFVPYGVARADWVRLLRRNPAEARLYHRERWIEALRNAYRFEFFVALLRVGFETRAGCLFALSQTPFSRRFVALPFSDSCHPLALDEGAGRALPAMLAGEDARAYELRGVALPCPWRTVDCFVNWELDLARPPAKLYRGLSENVRRNIVKARREGITIECGRDPAHLSRFRALHDESRRRQGLPSQPAKFFQSLWELSRANDEAEVWLASRGGRDLASVLVLLDGDIAYYKWSARAAGETQGAGHLLAWSIVEALAMKRQVLDLGRTDVRNHGLSRFKHGLGAISSPLPYSFLPSAPYEISPEILSGVRLLLARVWRHLPSAVCRALGGIIYRYLS
jgi:hypothetical protein